MSLWWLSFGDSDTGKNLGVAVVRGETLGDALARSHAIGVNPGGEVMAVQLPDTPEAREDLADIGIERLRTPSEMRDMGYVSGVLK